MDEKQIKELMEYISKSNFTEFELEREGFKLKLVKEGARNAMPQGTAVPPTFVHVPVGAPAAVPAHATSPVGMPSGTAPVKEAPVSEEGVVQVTSPMVGTFYRAPNPSSAAFVEVGSLVKKGQVLCIIEAMKLMNEIEAEIAGEIREIPVANGQPVEYGEIIFHIRPTS